MALTSVRSVKELDGHFVLTPERYDPRRKGLALSGAGGVLLRTLVTSSRDTVTAADSPTRRCLVFDTTDAREGKLVGGKCPQSVGELGSAKKIIEPNDVVISRLRPYLRQVAFVDADVRGGTDDLLLLGSTEFFALRPIDKKSIAFLVPFLLSGPVQQVLAASQEGGHHPRFNEAALLGLPVPAALLKNRDAISRAVERSVRMFRESEKSLTALVEQAEAGFGK
jgi:hypothetical protein